MIVFGWGRGSAVIGEGFFHTCGNCGNSTRFIVIEQSMHVRMYFVTVAKCATEYFYVCPICYCGAPLPDRPTCQRILANALRNPLKPDSELIRLIKP